MRRHILSGVLLLFVAGACAGCSKDYITNNIAEPGDTGVVGLVIPGEPGVRVSAWQATKIREVTADDSGYFAILGLASGVYEVRAATLTGQTVVYSGVRVSKGYVSTLVIHLDEPTSSALITSVKPANGDVNVPLLSTRIYLATREPLNVASLATSVQITPSIPGQWSANYVIYAIPDPLLEGEIVRAASTSYVFEPDSQWTPATLYTVEVLPTLETEDGTPWEDSLTFSFTTEPLALTCFYVNTERCGDSIIPLKPFQVTLNFNSAVSVDSINAAATFPAGFEGFWYYVEDYYYGMRTDRVRYFFTEPPLLRSGQAYTLTLSGATALAGPATLGSDFEVTLLTEWVKVFRILPAKGADAPTTTWIEIEFNTAMDQPSAEAASTLRQFGGAPVAASKVWLNDYKLTLRPDAPLALGQAYEVLVADTAVSAAGDTLSAPGYSFFRAAY